jgi:hypothetical protein
MADNNNAIWDKLPEIPHTALKKLDRLVGKWKISGPKVNGYTTYEWMEGGFFLIQHFDLTYDGERHKVLNISALIRIPGQCVRT